MMLIVVARFDLVSFTDPLAFEAENLSRFDLGVLCLVGKGLERGDKLFDMLSK